MKKLVLLIPILMMGCTKAPPSPTSAEAYFTARYSYTAVLAGAVGYKEVCAKQKKANHCHAVVAKLRQLDNAVKAAEDSMNRAMLASDVSMQEKAIVSYTAAVNALKTYKDGETI